MPMIGPNTLGTLIILLAAILQIVILSSAPYHPNINFLAATVNSNASNRTQAGILKMGVFGYCVTTSNGTDVCSSPSVGYAIDSKVILALPRLPPLAKLLDSIIQNLTKVLVLHVLATVLAGLSLIAGVISHVEEFSKTCWTSCLASLSAAVTLLVSIFDLIFFSILRARINAINSAEMSMRAEFGSAIGLTIAAWVSLAFSGCFFCAGRCLFSFRPKRSKNHARLEPFTNEKDSRFSPPYN
ncbi:hypothetical protein PCANC_17053 [Puccinia coronata f. sp. avenae]|uniref:MARVEL domain-containing protein n=1 Tax=Puccinia coronata f. sp. avenae TaxID=200324 RepID=A0A2N5SLB3_9BASI|nr:hypothetical protein PCANC_17053 [Puccinia coronata f. sp. avenae]